jgi:hypothetical protein
METIQGIIAWLQAHWAEIIQVITSIIGIASIIVKLTPTLKDDNVLLGVIKFIGKYIALNKTVTDSDRAKL